MARRVDINVSKILTRDNLIKDYSEYKNLNKIAIKYGVSNVTIKNYFNKLNIPYTKQIRHSCNDYLFKNNDEKSFYLAGLLAADGNLRISKGTKYIRISLAEEDYSLLELVKLITETSAPIRLQRASGDHSILGRNCNTQNLYSIEIASSEMFHDLFRFNVVPNKTKIFTIPNFMLDHPLKNHFLRGLVDGDGSWYIRNKQLNFSIIGTLEMISQFKSILNANCSNIFLDRKIQKNGTCYVLSYGGNNICKAIYNYLYKDANYFLKRKYDLITNHYCK